MTAQVPGNTARTAFKWRGKRKKKTTGKELRKKSTIEEERVDREFTFFYVLNISVVALSLVAGWS